MCPSLPQTNFDTLPFVVFDTAVRFFFLSSASKFSDALSDHVLGEFTRTEKKELDSIIADACDAVEHWIEEEDMAKVMTRFNSPR